jgi:hypothetical protein
MTSMDRYYITKTKKINDTTDTQIILSHSQIKSENLGDIYNMSYIEYHVFENGTVDGNIDACSDEASEYHKECNIFNSLVNSMILKRDDKTQESFTQIEEVKIKGIKYLLTLVPINLEVAVGQIENTMNLIMLF